MKVKALPWKKCNLLVAVIVSQYPKIVTVEKWVKEKGWYRNRLWLSKNKWSQVSILLCSLEFRGVCKDVRYRMG